MKSKIYFYSKITALICAITVVFWACQNDDSDLREASYDTNGEVFIDDFTSGLNYASFGGAVTTAFQVDNAVTYNNTAASMRFDVPNVNDPSGAYAGGTFFINSGRNLSGYNVLTFYAKASQAASIDVIGFGNDLGVNKYQASISGVQVNTTWKKFYIPIPDPSKLTIEKGMFFISEGPENNNGYSFWIDEVQFENLGTVAHPSASIYNGENRVATSFIGVTSQITGLNAIFNLPNGTNQAVNASNAYFTFSSSNTGVATVNDQGTVSTVGTGSAIITAKLGTIDAVGSLTINSQGNFVSAPTPTYAASNVISVFSNHYTNVPVDYYNGYWAPYQTTQSSDFSVNGDDVLHYTNFNFVGIQFASSTINASSMSHFHADIFVPNTVPSGAVFKVQIVNFGANNAYGGGDDSSHTFIVPSASLVGNQWISINIPFSAMTSLTGRGNLGQIIFEGSNISNFYADNVFFYNDGSIIPPTPVVAAPTPTHSSSNVISIFSDSYTNIAGTNLNPNWGQATVVTQVPIAGNNTLKFAGLNYQGIQLGSNQNLTGAAMTHLHIDYYTANSSSFKVYLISPGPIEASYSLAVPSGIGVNTNGWKSIDIPLSSFSPVSLSNIFQLKFDGNGDIFIDNLYFHN